eukprot:gene24660-3819_t
MEDRLKQAAVDGKRKICPISDDSSVALHARPKVGSRVGGVVVRDLFSERGGTATSYVVEAQRWATARGRSLYDEAQLSQAVLVCKDMSEAKELFPRVMGFALRGECEGFAGGVLYPRSEKYFVDNWSEGARDHRGRGQGYDLWVIDRWRVGERWVIDRWREGERWVIDR